LYLYCEFLFWNTGIGWVHGLLVCCRALTGLQVLQILEYEHHFDRADIYIEPPADCGESEEDSADEDAGGDVNNLSGHQLSSGVSAVITSEGVKQILDESDIDVSQDDSNGDEQSRPPSPPPPAIATIQTTIRKRKKCDMTVEDSGDSDGVLTVQPKPAAAVQRKWKKADLSVTWDPANIPSRSLSCSADPVNLFEIFFDDEVCSFLAQMTEEYAHNTHGCHDFSVDVADMRCFIAILLLSGYVDVPRWRMLWEVGSETYNPAVAQAMRRNRFDTIKHYLHCSDNSQLTPGDKFAKVRPLMSMLNERFLNVAQLEEHLCVDESMVPYYGRHGAKQFLKGKPIRFGYKFWCLCTRLGYVIQCEPYQGAGYMTYDKDLGLGASVVLDIVSELPQGCGFKLFGDRFFSSLKLVDQLKKKGIGYTGTVMSNRVERCPLSSSKEMTKKPRGSYDYLLDTTTDTLVVVWNDSCPVHLVSNVYGVNPVQACTRWISTTKKKESISQPSVVHMYNKYMGGVDRMDQNVGNYRVGIRSKKWWWPVFVFCLDTSLHNAWQLYRTTTEGKAEGFDYLQFRRKVVQAYFTKYGKGDTAKGRPRSSKPLESRVPNAARFDQTLHWIVPAKQNRCAVCRKNTTKKCEKCGVNLHDACFRDFHTK